MNNKKNDMGEDNPIKNSAAWFARLHGKPQMSDRDAFADWLDESPDHVREMLETERLWHELGRVGEVDAIQIARREARRGRNGVAIRRLVAMAVAVLLTVTGVGFVWPLVSRETLHTAVGQISMVGLADGTRVSLDTDTKLFVELKSAQRTIKLKRGQAFFDVAKDASRPFRVEVGDVSVTATGTQFDVYDNGDTVVVSLLEGRVTVEAPDPDKPGHTLVYYLSPGNQVAVNARRGIRKTDGDPSRAASWRYGHLEFDDVPLLSALDELNRYSETKIRLVAKMNGNMRISGVFKIGNPQATAAMLAAYLKLAVYPDGSDLALMMPIRD